MKVTAKLNNLRIAPRKVRLVANAIKGMNVDEAVFQLNHGIVKGSARPLRKLIESARANAEHNYGLDKNNLFVYDVSVNEGPIYKRWMPRAYGRATQIHKKTSHITIELEELIEGHNRKSKEDLEKERKARIEASTAEAVEKTKSATPEASATSDEDKEEKAAVTNEIQGKEESYKQSKQSSSGWAKKMFRRKQG